MAEKPFDSKSTADEILEGIDLTKRTILEVLDDVTCLLLPVNVHLQVALAGV